MLQRLLCAALLALFAHSLVSRPSVAAVGILDADQEGPRIAHGATFSARPSSQIAVASSTSGSASASTTFVGVVADLLRDNNFGAEIETIGFDNGVAPSFSVTLPPGAGLGIGDLDVGTTRFFSAPFTGLSTPPPSTSVCGEEADVSADALVCWINALRSQPAAHELPCSEHHLQPQPALQKNEQLMFAAAAHSNWQAAKDGMSSDGLDTRVRGSGYTRGSTQHLVAFGHRSARAAAMSWMCSDGYRAAMMGAGAADVGAGVAWARLGSGQPYWTAVIGSR